MQVRLLRTPVRAPKAIHCPNVSVGRAVANAWTSSFRSMSVISSPS
jgi:hypothetical protein